MALEFNKFQDLRTIEKIKRVFGLRVVTKGKNLLSKTRFLC